ncbi:MAG: cell wall hydrolase [Anaerolineaceae bacterium]|nr:MAG: cell wall hydrolase [Anaerolineaceae bacterium]
MNTIKKLFITLAAALFITLSFSHVAYATELDNADVIEEAGDIVNIGDQGNNENEDNTELEGYDSDTEDLYDPELYEIYVDEQGQVYYIEKEPVEPEIIDSDEILEDELEEKKVDEAKAKKPSYTEKELRLLSCLVYTEAGNQSYKGMLAVANVVLNRVRNNAYHHVDTIEEVIYDKQWAVQFSVTIKSKKTGKSLLDKALEAYDTGKFTGKNPEAEKKAMQKAIKAAKAALNGENNIGNYLCFRMNNSGASQIKKKYSDYRIIGDHIFYRTK